MNWKTAFTSIGIACVLFLSVACHKDSNSRNPLTACNISTTAATLPSAQTVTYSVVGTGTVTVISVTYKDAGGADVKVNSPTLPYAISVSGLSNSPIGISVVGTASGGGKLTAGYSYGNSNNIVTQIVDCSH